MNSRHAFFFAYCALFTVCASCAGNPTLRSESLEILTSSGTVVSVQAEIARTSKEQEIGYMGRTEIPDGTGMVFINTVDRRLNFWMKNTPHPLSIAYIDSCGIIREIYDLVPFSLDPVPSVHSLRYALEVPVGWFSRAGVAIGDRLTLESLEKLNRK